MSIKLRFAFVLGIAALANSNVSGHPVPKDSHDRTIVVRLQKGDAPDKVRVRVEYRVEVDETTIYLNDMRDFRDEVNPADNRGKPLEYYAQFTRIFAPIYADRFVARVNKKPIEEFRCLSRSQRLDDEDGKSLGHLRCDFVFESDFELDPAGKTQFFFREQNYFLEAGQIALSLVNETGLAIESKTEPDEALRKRALERPEPGDDDRLREITVVFAPGAARAKEMPSTIEPAPTPRESHDEWFNLNHLRHGNYGFFLKLCLAFLFGAAHALTPGHGKTLVAAYLVGERGTVWHALFLGVVTTLTHTGVVIVIAIILTFLSREMQQSFRMWIENGLGLVVGLIVAGMGFWLLLQRLAGRADHIHLPGGHHHHSAEPIPAPRTLSWWGLVVLGATGGMIPCWDAVGVLGIAVVEGEVWFVLPAVLVFSAGLAMVLVVIGILVVQAPRFVEARFGSGRVLQALPIVSAILVTAMGLWLCYDGVHGR